MGRTWKSNNRVNKRKMEKTWHVQAWLFLPTYSSEQLLLLSWEDWELWVERGQIFDSYGSLSIWEEIPRKKINVFPSTSISSSSISYGPPHKRCLMSFWVIINPKLPTPQALELTFPASLSGQFWLPHPQWRKGWWGREALFWVPFIFCSAITISLKPWSTQSESNFLGCKRRKINSHSSGFL